MCRGVLKDLFRRVIIGYLMEIENWIFFGLDYNNV